MASNNQYLAHATFVASFKLDQEIRYRVGEIEKFFQPVLSAQAVGTNVADSAQPQIPRFTLQSGPKQIAVSQVSVQLDMDFFEQKKSLTNSFPIVKKNFMSFWDGVCGLKSLDELKDIGLVLTINTPSKLSRNEISTLIFDRYFKAPKLGEIASSSFQVGFLDAKMNTFNNISVAAYEAREAKFIPPIKNVNMISIDIHKMQILESGFETKLDINSKPMVAENIPVTKELGPLLFKELEGLTGTKGQEFLNW